MSRPETASVPEEHISQAIRIVRGRRVLLDVDLKDNIPISLKISTLKTTGVKVVLMSTYSEPNIVRESLGS